MQEHVQKGLKYREDRYGSSSDFMEIEGKLNC